MLWTSTRRHEKAQPRKLPPMVVGGVYQHTAACACWIYGGVVKHTRQRTPRAGERRAP
jgi:hypothetical protein